MVTTKCKNCVYCTYRRGTYYCPYMKRSSDSCMQYRRAAVSAEYDPRLSFPRHAAK